MLSRISQFFTRQKFLTLFLWATCVLFGLLAYLFLLPRQGFPAIEEPIASLQGQLPIDDRATIDADVVSPIVDNLVAEEGVSSVISQASDNSFFIFLEMEEPFTSQDSADRINQAIEKADLPSEMVAKNSATPINPVQFLNEYDLLIGVRGPQGGSSEELEQVASETLAAYTSQPEIVSAEFIPLRNVYEGKESTIAFNQLLVNSDEFGPAITIGVKKSSGVDAVGLSESVEKALAEIEAAETIPEGYESFIAADDANRINSQLASLQSNVLTGILAVAFVALLLISWRASIITALFIFTVIATTFGVLYLFGITLNTISLFGVLLALGLFVDDSIVITEAIDSFRSKDDSPMQVIGHAIKRVGSASVSGTLTTVLVFAPMLAISGLLGKFIWILPVSVIVALVVSLILSLILIPLAARYLVLPVPKAEGPLIRFQEKIADRLAQAIGFSGRKGLLVGIAGISLSLIMTFVGMMVFRPQLKLNIFPPQKDSISLLSTYRFAPDTSVEDAERISLEINQKVDEALGEDLELGYLYLGNASVANNFYRLSPLGTREKAPDVVSNRLNPIAEQVMADQPVDVTFEVQSEGPPVEEFPFKVQIFDDSSEELSEAAERLAAELNGQKIERANGSFFTVTETRVNFAESIARRDGKKYIEVVAKFDSDDVTELTTETKSYVQGLYTEEKLASAGLEADALSFDFGVEGDTQDSFNSMPFAFGLALLAMLLLLVAQFRSSVQWILVILAVPFSFFGVFGGLLLTNNQVSFFVFLGLLGLMGIAVNNTILLTDFANQERKKGLDRTTAMQNAIRERFRPLLVTTVTTVVGLLPLVLSDPFWESLGYTIIFGLISSTFLVIFSFPFYYLGVEFLRDRFVSPWRRKGA